MFRVARCPMSRIASHLVGVFPISHQCLEQWQEKSKRMVIEPMVWCYFWEIMANSLSRSLQKLYGFIEFLVIPREAWHPLWVFLGEVSHCSWRVPSHASAPPRSPTDWQALSRKVGESPFLQSLTLDPVNNWGKRRGHNWWCFMLFLGENMEMWAPLSLSVLGTDL